MKIAISIDSACDMPQELKQKYNIFTIRQTGIVFFGNLCYTEIQNDTVRIRT